MIASHSNRGRRVRSLVLAGVVFATTLASVSSVASAEDPPAQPGTTTAPTEVIAVAEPPSEPVQTDAAAPVDSVVDPAPVEPGSTDAPVDTVVDPVVDPVPSDVPADAPVDHVAEIREAFRTDDDGVVPVIVSLRDDAGVPLDRKEAHFRAQRDRLVGNFKQDSLRALRALDGAPFASMHVTRSQFAVLRTLPQVADITLDRVVETDGTTYYGGAGGQQLPKSWEITRVGADWTNANGWTGAGMYVAVIDSMIDRNHPYLRGRVVNEACFATNPNGTGACNNGKTYDYAQTRAGVAGAASWAGCTFNYSGCSHGTHVAHSAAGAYGIARGASIIAIRAGHQEWSVKDNAWKVLFSNSDLLTALWYVHSVLPKSQITAAAVNMSIGGAVYAGTCDNAVPEITSYITRLRNELHIPTVISAGNDNSATGVSWPACISTAVAVGNSTMLSATNSSDAVFGGGLGASNSSSLIDLWAPGTDICSAVPTWLKADGWDCGWYGTSMAAPQVAGAMAVLTQKRPSATVNQLLVALQRSGSTGGTALTDGRNGVTRTRINVAMAVYYGI